jgi:hypothetical protein
MRRKLAAVRANEIFETFGSHGCSVKTIDRPQIHRSNSKANRDASIRAPQPRDRDIAIELEARRRQSHFAA